MKLKNRCKNDRRKTHRNDCEQSWEGDKKMWRERDYEKSRNDFTSGRSRRKQEKSHESWRRFSNTHENDSSIASLMEMFRCVWEEFWETVKTTAAAKEKRTKKRKVLAALRVKRSILSWTKWRAEVKISGHVLLRKRMNFQKNKEVTFIILQKKHEINALKWKNSKNWNLTRGLQMGRDFIEWDVETWDDWTMGDVTQIHLHESWKIRQQIWDWHHTEQKMEKKNYWHRVHQRALHQYHDSDHSSTHQIDECVLPTLEICESSHREDIQSNWETHDEQ